LVRTWRCGLFPCPVPANHDYPGKPEYTILDGIKGEAIMWGLSWPDPDV
jgi:hypothetical protein